MAFTPAFSLKSSFLSPPYLSWHVNISLGDHKEHRKKSWKFSFLQPTLTIDCPLNLSQACICFSSSSSFLLIVTAAVDAVLCAV